MPHFGPLKKMHPLKCPPYMPTAYDAPQKESWPTEPVSDPVIRKNRETLISVMERNGFKVYSTEWWHFDFIGWQKFAVMNIDFEELD